MTLKPALFVVAIPVGAMLTWLLSLMTALTLAREVTLPVTGYDPRDLLYGHYLSYRVNYGITFPYPSIEPSCVCLSQGADGIAQATCPLFIRGTRDRNEFNAGIERYYIPEQYQHALSSIPQNTTIKVRVAKSGSAYVTDMYVDGTPILEWAKTQPLHP